MDVSAIVAVDVNNGIGYEGKLPWHIPADLRRFKELTTGHTVIMGRKTYDSLPNGALPGRENIVLTRDKNFNPKGVTVFHTPNEVMRNFVPEKKYFVIGGQDIFTLFLNMCHTMYQTYIFREFDMDRYFKSRSDYWTLESEEIIKNDPDVKFPYAFRVYKRKYLDAPKKKQYYPKK